MAGPDDEDTIPADDDEDEVPYTPKEGPDDERDVGVGVGEDD